ncbi:hypothetical protein FQN53_000725 [Emmonsiellopsis sp. PD_33]|nr:hypothetical protein FQN53_000725 [Emmonsiellopsis sp. PD_33]KAK2797723.1 hypothetical protein FQN51_008302 [Onygenales sp. PD_10]
MRTRSQPISPSGFQSLETAPRKRKAPSSAAPARKGPAKNSNNPAKVAKSKAGKRAPKTKKAPAATSTPTPSTPTPARPEQDGPSPQPESSNALPAEEPSILDALEHNANSAVPTPPTPEVESSANAQDHYSRTFSSLCAGGLPFGFSPDPQVRQVRHIFPSVASGKRGSKDDIYRDADLEHLSSVPLLFLKADLS